MITRTLKRLAFVLMMLTVQVLILDQVHPWGYGAPLLCPLVVITLPLGMSRSEALLWGFGTGFVADIFAGTSGIGSAALTFIAFLQPIALCSDQIPARQETDLIRSRIGNSQLHIR